MSGWRNREGLRDYRICKPQLMRGPTAQKITTYDFTGWLQPRAWRAVGLRSFLNPVNPKRTWKCGVPCTSRGAKKLEKNQDVAAKTKTRPDRITTNKIKPICYSRHRLRRSMFAISCMKERGRRGLAVSWAGRAATSRYARSGRSRAIVTAAGG
jgi:hypothetical protein